MTISLCKYRHALGVEGEGYHSVRVFGVAIFDVLATLLLGFFIAYYMRINIYIVWLWLFLLGIILHRLFCVNTRINILLFGKL